MDVLWPEGFKIEQLLKVHDKKSFNCGIIDVDEWLKKRALQSQKKHLSVTKVLLDEKSSIIGYYTLAIGQVNFDKLPENVSRKMPKTLLPIITIAWHGIKRDFQGKGFGERLLACALSDCYNAAQNIPVVAVMLDCVDNNAKNFYFKYDFKELPGYPMKLFLPYRLLQAMMR